MSIRADAIVEAARTLVGTPYRHQGRQPGQGLDCVGVVICVARILELGDWTETNYGRLPNPRRMGDILRAKMREVDGPPQPADVLWISFSNKRPTERTATHLALCSGPGRIIHAYQPARAVVETTLSDDMRRRIVAIFRYPDLA